MKRLILTLALLTIGAPANADPAIHYAPAENLEKIDVGLIDTARQEIDLAAYVLTDWPVIQALKRAADRGGDYWRTWAVAHILKAAARPWLALGISHALTGDA
jgi:phosphatidylserine/phosphatidylglycerophosphate/cardiolipin synthase-like enzyme